MDLYLAGPMRGYPRWNFDAFEHATKTLRYHRNTVRSPHEHDLDIGLDPDAPDADAQAEGSNLAECLRWDFVQVCEAGNVVLLPGWEASTGCAMELRVARDVRANVYELIHASTGGVEFRVLELDEQLARQRNVATSSNPYHRGDVGRVQWTTDPGPQVPVKTSEHRVTSSTGGEKGQKDARLGALDAVALLELAKVGAMGEVKYSRFNYLRGYAWSLSVDALYRHLLAFLSGEDNDEESGLPHTAHAAWHALCLTSFLKRGIGTDDRADHD